MKIFETTIRARYQETDGMGVVYYANYFVWFEVARTDLLRNIGFSYRKMEEEGYRFMVVESSCKYLSPCRYDDLVTVRTWVSEVRNTSMTFEYTVAVALDECAHGKTVHVFTDASLKPVKIPRELKRTLTSLA